MTPAFLKDFWRDENGATAIEYALIAGGIAVAMIVSVNALGVDVAGLFTTAGDGFN